MMRRKDKGTRQVVVFNYDTLVIWDLRVTSSCYLSTKSISSVVGVLLMASSCSLSTKSISSVVGVSLMT
jgi:hypothetical protein